MITKTGIIIRGSRGRRDVKGPVIQFAKWLRKKHEFPIRVTVYLLPGESFATLNGDEVVASFRWSIKGKQPCIRLATGDYPSLCKQRGKAEALESILLSLARQIIRYQNWCATGKCADTGIRSRSNKMIEEYLKK